ncbi:FtsX-like permease family protein [bacterium]|nr:FtsX-like permease family protein [bacterium]
MGFETFIASRYLRSPRKDRSISVITKISIIGVAIGVMALIVALSVMNGFENDLKSALQKVNGDLTIYSLSPDGIKWDADKALATRISETIDIKAYAPFTQNQAFIIGKHKPMITLVKGIDINLESGVTPINFFIRTQSFESKRDNSLIDNESKPEIKEILEKLKPHSEPIIDQNSPVSKKKTTGIIIGSQLAKELSVDIGDWITIMSLEARITPMGDMPRAKRFRIVGFFESGLPTADEFFSIMDIEVAQKVFKSEGRISGLTLSVENRNLADEYKETLQDEIGFPYIINTWIDQNRNLFAMFELEKFGLAVILTLIILIAAFNIISSLIMLVIEKNKDIAILKAMGAKDRSIRKIFMIQGIVIGLAGTIIGEILGLTICWILANFDIIDIPPGVYVGNRISVHVEIWQISLIALISFLICFLVTIAPSRKASKLDPVQGLRNE